MSSIINKTAIVTGGAMGIGLATAKRLLAEGCVVTIWDVNAAALKQAVKELKNGGGKVFAYPCDVTDNKTVKRLVRKAIVDMGGINILVNNAGIERHGGFCDKPIADWELVMKVNVSSLFYTIHAVLPHLYAANSGCIVNVSSAAGIIGVGELAAYCASKWAVWGLTESLRHEALSAGKNVHFSSIHPIFLREGLFAGGHLNWLGDLLVPPVKSHDVVAKAIVNRAIKRRHNTVKIPRTLWLGVLFRGLIPDAAFMFVAAKLFGAGQSMKDWVGHRKA